jgi:hypothetical protein
MHNLALRTVHYTHERQTHGSLVTVEASGACMCSLTEPGKGLQEATDTKLNNTLMRRVSATQTS